MPQPGATGIVLAGGRSRRMGRDKLPLLVGGVPILRRVCETLLESCDEVLAVGIDPAEAGESAALPAECRVVRDLRPEGAGPLAGLEAGLSHARYPLAFVAAGDMPFLPPGLVSETLGRLRAGGAHAVAPRRDGRWEPLCAAYSRTALEHVSRALDEGVRAVRDLLEELPEVEEIPEPELRRFGEPELLLMNVNSPEDLVRAREAVSGG